jgi:phospholipid transport system substrate-binding protein
MKSVFACIYAVLLSVTCLSTVQAQPKPADDEITKTVKNVFANLRTGKSAKVFQFVDLDAVSRNLLLEEYEKGTEAQRKEFASLFQSLYAKIGIPKISEKFKKVVSAMFDRPEVKGSKAWVSSIIVFDHPLKKEELKLKYSLVKSNKGWRVTDVAVLGSSIVQTIRNEQIKPVLEKGGLDTLLKTMREKDAEWR